MDNDELIERITSNLDHCELVELLDLDIYELINLLEDVIIENREKFYFLEDAKYREL